MSYASADRERVLEIVERFEQLGLSIWIDRSGIAGGASYGAEIVDAIQHAKSVALMSSASSLTSKNVRQEIMLAWRYGTPIVPLMLEPVTVPDEIAYWLEGFPWLDAQAEIDEWLSSFVRRLVSVGVDVDIRQAELAASPGDTVDARSNLPETDGQLYGREQAVLEIESLLEHGRWITLTGPGGTGKTRLAIEIGKRQKGVYEDGVWFVDLTPIGTADQVLPTIADVFMLETQGEQSPADLLKNVLDGRHTLLILDNFEHVSEGAPELAELQEMLPMLDILVTSRAPLRTRLEWAFEVSQLPLPDATGTISAAELARNPAIALFVERAMRARPDFTLSEGNARAVAEICARLEGLPLAIELAAARVRLLPPPVLLMRLGSRLSVLSDRSRSGERQGTLQDTIAWSYDLLAPEQQRLFRLLGVFRGPSTFDAVAVVSEADEIEQDILALIDQSLVKAVHAGGHQSQRYSMLETIREFAALQLDLHGETSRFRERHAQFFSHQIASLSSDDSSEGSYAEKSDVLRLVRADDANVHAAIDWFRETGDDAAEVAMITSLFAYWIHTGRSQEGEQRLSSAIDRANELSAGLLGVSRLVLGRFRSISGDAGNALRMFEQALTHFDQAADLPGQADVLIEMGRISERDGRLDIAADCFSRAALGYASAGLKRSHAEALHETGVLHIYRGDFPAAIVAITESIDEFRNVGELRMVAEALSDLGSAEMLAGDATAAQTHLRDGLTIFGTLDDAMAVAVLTTNLGRAQQIAGDLDGARSTLMEALQLSRDVGDRANEAVTLYGLGKLPARDGDPAAPEELLKESLDIAWQNGDLWLVVQLLEAFAQIRIDRVEFDAAVLLFGSAMAMRDEAGTFVNPSEEEEYTRAMQRAEETTGAERFATLIERGRASSAEEVVARLLSGS